MFFFDCVKDNSIQVLPGNSLNLLKACMCLFCYANINVHSTLLLFGLMINSTSMRAGCQVRNAPKCKNALTLHFLYTSLYIGLALHRYCTYYYLSLNIKGARQHANIRITDRPTGQASQLQPGAVRVITERLFKAL